jgi:hypothetical protein
MSFKMKNRQPRRKRGVLLTQAGQQKLQQAKLTAEYQENEGNRYTYEGLSGRTRLSVDTVMKIFTGEVAIDKQTLIRCFDSFNLTLEPQDYYWPQFEPNPVKTLFEISPSPKIKLELPNGPVPLGSSFYVERLSTESYFYQMVLQPAAWIQIRGPKQIGKTSLMIRILQLAQQQQYHLVILNLLSWGSESYLSSNQFLQHFCAYVSKSVGLAPQIAEYWDEHLSSSCNATHYFGKYLLTQLDRPLVVALDEINYLFQYSEIATDFLQLLQTWYEKAKYSYEENNVWKQLRLILVCSTANYPEPNQTLLSPLGEIIELSHLTAEQVYQLARQHGWNCSIEQINQLITLIGNHPHRVRTALYDLCQDYYK